MKHMTTTANQTAQDRFGRQLAACLDTSAEELPHAITERLRVARLQAVGKLREVQAREFARVPLGGGVAALGPGGSENGLWPRLISLVPLMALIAGLVAIQVLGTDQITQELADIDAALLTDDLPPDAYTDPGFAQFLKNKLGQLQQQD